MSDLPEFSEVAKVGGGMGAGGIVAFMLSRVLRSEDKVLERIEALAKDVHEMSTKLAVLVSDSSRRDGDLIALRAQVNGQQRTISRIEVAVAKLGVKVSDGGDGN